MAIKVFVYSLLFLTLLSFFVSASGEKTKKRKISNNPDIVFDNSIMYNLSQEGMTRIVLSKKAEKYKNKDVMYDGKIITESKKGGYTDFISADLMIKRGNKFKFLNNAKYNRENFIELNSDEILYNTKTRIATNNLPFTGKYYDHIINGKNLYFNTYKSIFKAQNAHFEIQMQKQ